MKKILIILIVVCGTAAWFIFKKDEAVSDAAKTQANTPPSFAEIKNQADQTAAELQEKLKDQQRRFDEMQNK